MVGEHSTLRVTAEPFIPQKTVPAGGRATPLKICAKDAAEFATPSKQYRLRELSPEEIASKSIRPSPIRQQKTFSPVALFDSPLRKTPTNQTRVNRNSCSKLHCKRCAYREQQSAKGGQTRRELEFQKDHDENCSFAGLDAPETPSKSNEPSTVIVKEPLPELPKPRRRVSTPQPESSTTPQPLQLSPKTASLGDRVTNTSATPAPSCPKPVESASPVFVGAEAAGSRSTMPPQHRLRAGLLILVAMLLVLLLVQRNGVWKSGLRTLAAAVVALGTAIFLGPVMVSSARPTLTH